MGLYSVLVCVCVYIYIYIYIYIYVYIYIYIYKLIELQIRKGRDKKSVWCYCSKAGIKPINSRIIDKSIHLIVSIILIYILSIPSYAYHYVIINILMKSLGK